MLMNRIFRYLDSVANGLYIVMTSVMVLAIFIQVVCRYVFNHALPWPEEVARFLFCLSCYVALSISMRGDANLRITFLLDNLPPRPRTWLNMLCSFVNILFFIMFFYLAGDITWQIRDMGQTAVSMPFPIWIIWVGITFCAALAALQAARNLYLIATGQIGQKQNPA